ncbi:hypothetical protein ACWDYH_07240 [Nocardia goodfellowii]
MTITTALASQFGAVTGTAAKCANGEISRTQSGAPALRAMTIEEETTGGRDRTEDADTQTEVVDGDGAAKTFRQVFERDR